VNDWICGMSPNELAKRDEIEGGWELELADAQEGAELEYSDYDDWDGPEGPDEFNPTEE